MLAADGELSGREREQLRKHTAQCRECGARAQQLAAAADEFARLHRQSLDPLLPPPARGRAWLEARLGELSSARAEGPWPLSPVWRRGLIAAAGACVLLLVSIAVPHPWSSRRARTMYAGLVPMPFPTATLTPGVARPATKEQVCGTDPGKNREVPQALRRKVFELYGMAGADPRAYEVDYLITPALGGADDIENLWPEPYTSTVWNARVKDALEDRLHEMVCRGDVELATAQREIATDWIAAYKKYFRTDQPIE